MTAPSGTVHHAVPFADPCHQAEVLSAPLRATLERGDHALAVVDLDCRAELDRTLVERIKQQIRTKASGRHVPDAVVQVSEIPRTLSGKKMEVPVRRLLLGAQPGQVASPDAMQNPASLDFFAEYAHGFLARHE